MFVSKPKKNAIRISAQDRCKEYPRTFHVSDGIMFCTNCNVSIDHTRKSVIDNHLKSYRHEEKKRKADQDNSSEKEKKRQATVSSMFKRQTDSGEKRNLLHFEIVDAFASANIPLEKLDHPKLRELITKNMEGAGALPCANSLRQNYLPKLFEAKKQELKEILKSAESVCIGFDEGSDDKDNYVLHILAVPQFTNSGTLHPYLLNSVRLESVQSTTVSQAVVQCLTDMEIDFNKVSAILTDNATYMTRAYKNALHTLLPNSVHMTCNAHIINLASDQWRVHFAEVDKFTGHFKKIFKHCPSRKRRYLKFLTEKKKQDKLCPVPITTRWNSWFETVQYHAKYWDIYIDFFDSEIELTPDTLSLNVCKSMLEECNYICQDFQFISEHAQILMDTLLFFETCGVSVHKAYNRVLDLRSKLQLKSKEMYSRKATRNLFLQEVFHKTVAKLNNYYNPEEVNSKKLGPKFSQPGLNFMKAVRVFDPDQLMNLHIDDDLVFKSIPGMDNSSLKLEFSAYKEYVKECSITDVIKFWTSKVVSERFPGLTQKAKQVLSVLPNSVDCERAVSCYVQIFTKQRQSLQEFSAAGLTSLNFNKL